MQSFIKHLHAFVRDIEPTEAEWATAIDFLTRIGQKCDDKRQEFILFSDVMGVSMLVDAINHRQSNGATPTTVEGPFHVPNAPAFGDGANMAAQCAGHSLLRHRHRARHSTAGRSPARRSICGRPMAKVSTRRSATSTEPWMRGAFPTQPDGSYTIRTVAPIGYSIPMDGPIGELVKRTDISEMRPAHIHFCIEAPGYHRVVTHLFQRGCPWIETDVVYGVKEPLIVDFKKMPAGTKAPSGELMNEPFYMVHYDFVLDRKAQAAAA